MSQQCVTNLTVQSEAQSENICIDTSFSSPSNTPPSSLHIDSICTPYCLGYLGHANTPTILPPPGESQKHHILEHKFWEMCGRARCSLSREEVRAQAQVTEWRDEDKYQISYNVSPGQSTPVLKQAGAAGKELHTMKWGLIPSYTKSGEKPDFWRMFNARSETIAEKGVFSKLIAGQRCVVFVNSFYEWKKEGKQKQPYLVYREGKDALQMAGLYDIWKGAEGEPLFSFTILTTDTSERLAWLHDRMPCILPDQAACDQWLSGADTFSAKSLNELCVPYNGEDLQWYPVDPRMNNGKVDDPQVCQPMKRQPITAFFKPKADVKEEAAAAPLGPSSTKEEKPHAVKEEAGVGRAPDGAEVAADEGFEARTEAEEEGKNVKAKGEGSAKGPGSPALPELVPQGRGSAADDEKGGKGSGRKRPASSPAGRSVKPKTPEKGKITAFFEKNVA